MDLENFGGASGGASIGFWKHWGGHGPPGPPGKTGPALEQIQMLNTPAYRAL